MTHFGRGEHSRKTLEELLERIHGSTQHIGRIPDQSSTDLAREREIIELKRDLSRVIQREEYERAAAIRDRIREIEGASSVGTD